MSHPDRRPFRAGLAMGESRELAEVMPPDFGASVTLLADVSEFQPDINDDAYIKNFSEAIIIRAAYGAHHDDHAWFGGDRRKQLHDRGIKFLGIYQYITAFEDVTAQAREFCRLIGSLRNGEVAVADIEEGSGSQSNRWRTWSHVVQSELGDEPWNYSGENFAATTGLAPVDWIAAYRSSEPAAPHKLWQFTSTFRVPGVGTSDCSVFHGPVDELAALAHGGRKPQTDWTEEAIMALPTLKEGARDDGSGYLLVHRIQNGVAGIGRWNKLGAVATDVKDDGVFGPGTTKGVKAVQKFFGLAEDGIVGKDTWTKLIGA
jgi:GH25 family lysozyme M1 (1,4-beta-N-acetylmuramidase)